MGGPLAGIRILDWTIWQQGPACTSMLGDLGAEVIKIEDRQGGDPGRGMVSIYGLRAEIAAGRNGYFETNNRNKKSITLDLKKERGKQVLYRLVKASDVFVQNYRPGVAERLRVGCRTLSQYNPLIIYASASGYGPEGPECQEPTFDLLGLARSGFMNNVGEPGMPPLAPRGGIADQMGAIMLGYGIMAALIAREKQGVGQEVNASHLGAMISLQRLALASRLLAGKAPERETRSRAKNPLWNWYRCSDNRWIVLAHLQPDRYWPPLCQALGMPGLAEDPRFRGFEARAEHAEELTAILDAAFASRPCAEWMKILKDGRDMICNPVNSVDDLPDDPQVLANNYVVDYEHPVLGPIKVVGDPVVFSKTPGNPRAPAPELGQHTEEVLLEVGGYTWEEIEGLRTEEVI